MVANSLCDLYADNPCTWVEFGFSFLGDKTKNDLVATLIRQLGGALRKLAHDHWMEVGGIAKKL